MDMMIRSKIQDLIEVFYHSPFKIFYINSIDGEKFSKSIGIFVSLGITTSMETLENLKSIILRETSYKAEIAEITSKSHMGQHLNKVINLNPSQYLAIPDNSMGRDESVKELDRILNEDKNFKEYSKLSGLIKKLDEMSGWENHGITKEPYQIFHKKVNYKKDGDLEYRIGIYVI